MKDIRLIALDMDGTLLSSDHTVSEQNKEAIKKAREKGVEVIISTGRHFRTSAHIAKELDIHYIINVNGSEIWTMEEELIAREIVDASIIKKLIELKNKHKTWAWSASTDQIWRDEFPDNVEDYTWLKFGFDTDNDETKQLLMATLEEWKEIELSNSSLTNIEVNAVGVNKAKAVEVVCERLGITMDQVMACGDSLNDIKMIEQAGIGVAMGNAQDKVKEASDWITTSNDEAGVAQAINKFVLK
ncbi:Cof-type HAD-IIB family hydrolase [Gracilibacillus marinus]|uniref:Cof-type HAD-IIB family hydrolase n=1 Tax=Gracilibacillus marinus TaxID=630535 RepID=A0ABV8W077_9BACI